MPPYVNAVRPSHPSVLTSASSSSYPSPTTLSDMNYPIQRPLHPLHINTSRWSSLEGAMGTPRYINVPIKHDKSSPRPGNSPRPVEPPRITIHFDSGRGTPGVSFGDAKNGKLHWMGDQFIPELLNLGQNSVNLVIYVRAMYRIDTSAEAEYASQWPGYGHVQNTFPLEICVNNRPVTRAYLAQQVAKAYERFFDVRASRDRVSSPALIPAHHTGCAKGDLRGHTQRERHDVGDRPELLPHALRSSLHKQRAPARSWSLPGGHPDPHGLAGATCSTSLSPLPRSHHSRRRADARRAVPLGYFSIYAYSTVPYTVPFPLLVSSTSSPICARPPLYRHTHRSCLPTLLYPYRILSFLPRAALLSFCRFVFASYPVLCSYVSLILSHSVLFIT